MSIKDTCTEEDGYTNTEWNEYVKRVMRLPYNFFQLPPETQTRITADRKILIIEAV